MENKSWGKFAFEIIFCAFNILLFPVGFIQIFVKHLGHIFLFGLCLSIIATPQDSVLRPFLHLAHCNANCIPATPAGINSLLLVPPCFWVSALYFQLTIQCVPTQYVPSKLIYSLLHTKLKNHIITWVGNILI